MFAFNEVANYAGRPTYLFEFQRDTVTWRYASADRDGTLDGHTYSAVPITCGAIRQTGDAQSDELTITMPVAAEFVTSFRLVPPTERVMCIIRRYHRDDDDAVVRWAGFVDRIRQTSPAKAEVIGKTLRATFRRGGARLMWARQCPHMIYDRAGCKVQKEAHGVSGIVSALDGQQVTSPPLASLPDGRFSGGFIEWITPDGIKARRAIRNHAGSAVALLGGTSGIEVGTGFVAYPSCYRNRESCVNDFNNLPNFGGVAHLPMKSPFDGNPVF